MFFIFLLVLLVSSHYFCLCFNMYFFPLFFHWVDGFFFVKKMKNQNVVCKIVIIVFYFLTYNFSCALGSNFNIQSSNFKVSNMPRKLDPLWEFGELDHGFDRLNLTCKLCGQHMSGGVYRLKYHLAQIPGHEVGHCKNTNPEIIKRAMNSLGEIETT